MKQAKDEERSDEDLGIRGSKSVDRLKKWPSEKIISNCGIDQHCNLSRLL